MTILNMQSCSQTYTGSSGNQPLQVLYILEALEVQAQDFWQLLDLDALLCFL